MFVLDSFHMSVARPPFLFSKSCLHRIQVMQLQWAKNLPAYEQCQAALNSIDAEEVEVTRSKDEDGKLNGLPFIMTSDVGS